MLHTFSAGEDESESLVECKLACDKYDHIIGRSSIIRDVLI